MANTDPNHDYAWLEVSLLCSGELAEAISELFSRYVPDGVVLHSITSFDNADYEEVPTGEMRVVAYLPNDAALENKLYKLEESLFYIRQIMPFGELETAWVENQDWMASWKQHYKPLEIGKNLMILPAWVDPQLAGDRVPIIISPDMAFGTGTHPSTQLCLIALEQYG
ncbi:MAG: 50S ribosomal protein L11 methyltransferase, partial [Chloroflexi bacterium]|nr:50S ribosomal protein L11 methyltransferase [Chloroflexota bacterium]